MIFKIEKNFRRGLEGRRGSNLLRERLEVYHLLFFVIRKVQM
jgi:hypothetical protein